MDRDFSLYVTEKQEEEEDKGFWDRLMDLLD